jgi:RNA polymerase sigma-70 factor (ECF subfamily)
MHSLPESTPKIANQAAEVALPLLLEEHGGHLYRMSLKLCGHPQDAEDLVQEIFLIAFRKWHQFAGNSHPTTWLYTIAARACSRRRRKRAGEPRTIDSLSELLPSAEDQIPDLATIQGPLDEQLQREAQEAVEKAIASLPMHFRMPLVLKEIVELPISEVAAILGLKKATVKTRVHRGRLLLRRELSRTLPQQDAPPPDHSRQMCLDLLRAKQESLDRGVPFRVPQEELCLRCRAMFSSLDIAQEICQAIGRGEMPLELHEDLSKAFEDTASRAREATSLN